MTIQLIQTDIEFINLKDEWNTLLKYSASHVPFLRHEYLFNWWKTLGGGEWDQAKLAILLQRDENETLMGIAPFFLVDQQIRFLGSIEISDYLDFITAVDNLTQFTNKILQFVQSDHFPAWDRIILDNIPDSSPTLKTIEKFADQTDLKFELSVVQPAPFIKLPKSWEDYLLSLEDRYRQELERKIRKAESYFLPVDWYIVDDTKDLICEMNDFLELMANNPDKKKFLTEKMVQQMVSGADVAFQEGWLQLAFLVVGDQKIGGYLNFDFNNKIWIYNSGINPLFENLSPGWVLLGKLIHWAIQEGKSEVDFMRGDEKYKYQFGGIDKHVLRLILSK